MTVTLPKSSFDTSRLENTTLFLPTVSTGNVPQLLVDLLINSNLGTARIGSLNSPYILNVFGPDAFQSLEFQALPIEVYSHSEHQWTFLQFRAPIIQPCAKEFCATLVKWIKSVGFKSIFLVVSADAAYRTDCLIEGTPTFRTFGSSLPLTVKPLESEFLRSNLKGASLFSECLKAFESQNLSHICSGIVIFTSEGDNMQDTLMAWKILEKSLFLPSPVPPVSWKQLHGPPMNDEDIQNLY